MERSSSEHSIPVPVEGDINLDITSNNNPMHMPSPPGMHAQAENQQQEAEIKSSSEPKKRPAKRKVRHGGGNKGGRTLPRIDSSVKLDSLNNPLLKNALACFDADGDGRIDLDEVNEALRLVAQGKENRSSFDIAGFPAVLQKVLAEFDENGDGEVSVTELAQAAMLYRQRVQQNKLFRRVLIGLGIFAVILLLGVFALSYSVMVLSKETEYGNDGSMRVKDSGEIVQVASSDFYLDNGVLKARSGVEVEVSDAGQARLLQGVQGVDFPAIGTRDAYVSARLTSNLPDSYFEELRFLKLVSPQQNSLSLTVEGILRTHRAGSLCGSVLHIFTAAGTVEVDGNQVRIVSGGLAEAFEIAGFRVHGRSSSGRRLVGVVELMGLFNTIDDYEFDCPLVKKPSLNSTILMRYTSYSPCTPPPGHTGKWSSPCDISAEEHGSVDHPAVVTYNGMQYQRHYGLVARHDGISVGVEYSDEGAAELHVNVLNATTNLGYRLRDGIAVGCTAKPLESAQQLMHIDPSSIHFSYVSIESIGGREVDYFVLRGAVPRELVSNTTGENPEDLFPPETLEEEGDPDYVYVTMEYYEDRATKAPVRVVDHYGGFSDYYDVTSDVDAITPLMEAYSRPVCDDLNPSLIKAVYQYAEDEEDMVPIDSLPETTRRRLQQQPGNSFGVEYGEDAGFYHDEEANVTVVNTGDLKALRWVVTEDDGSTQCVSASQVTPSALHVVRCDLTTNLQHFRWRGQNLYQPQLDLCVGFNGDTENLGLVSCTAGNVVGLWQSLERQSMGVIGKAGCINAVTEEVPAPSEEELEEAGLDDDAEIVTTITNVKVSSSCNQNFAVRIMENSEVDYTEEAMADGVYVEDDSLFSNTTIVNTTTGARLLGSSDLVPRRLVEYGGGGYGAEEGEFTFEHQKYVYARILSSSSNLTAEEQDTILELAMRDRAVGRRLAEEAARMLYSDQGSQERETFLSLCMLTLDFPYGCDADRDGKSDGKCYVTMCINLWDGVPSVSAEVGGKIFKVITIYGGGSIYVNEKGYPRGEVYVGVKFGFDVGPISIDVIRVTITLRARLEVDKICKYRVAIIPNVKVCKKILWWKSCKRKTIVKLVPYDCWNDVYWEMDVEGEVQRLVVKGVLTFSYRFRDQRKNLKLCGYYQEFWNFWSGFPWKKFKCWRIIKNKY